MLASSEAFKFHMHDLLALFHMISSTHEYTQRTSYVESTTISHSYENYATNRPEDKGT